MSTLVTGNVITDATITREKLAFDPYITSSGFRNKIINGDFRVWQRGISFSNPTYDSIPAQFAADRWQSVRGIYTTGITTSRSTDAPSGFQYSLKQQRTAGDTSGQFLTLIQTFETKDTIPLQNSQITVSFYAKSGSSWSAISQAIGCYLYQNTTVDQNYLNIATNFTSLQGSTKTISQNWNRYSFTFNILSTTTQMFLTLNWNPAGTAGADDSLYITGVQLEAGNLTDFEFRPYDIELPLCQRYYTTSYRPGSYPTDTPVDGIHHNAGNPNVFSPRNGTLNVLPCQVRFPIQMRRVPTVTIYKPTTNTANQVVDFGNANTVNVSSVVASQNGISLINLAANPAYAGYAYEFQYTANAELDI